MEGQKKRTLSSAAAVISALGIIFVVELITPSDVAVGGLYVLPTFVAAVMLPERAAVAVLVSATALQIAALLLGRANVITVTAETAGLIFAFCVLRFVRLSRRPISPLKSRSSGELKAPLGCDTDSLEGTLEPLTNRERQVAELAAEGRSAKDIARQLAIGHRTVETHLAHAYEKLGIGSRAELILMRDRRLAAVKDKNDSERFTDSRR